MIRALPEDGHAGTSRRDDVLAVQVLAARRPAPDALTVEVLWRALAVRGCHLRVDDVQALATLVLAGEVYAAVRRADQMTGLCARD